ncbi:MAG: hypothetical protein KatS3mg131_3199 [Candidatus Tectimicrobiota bacterium]|nr:MAG: hypothetical protein KatS3mg131_3199 [Candidatus Tectomicrobia bacterium]
MGEKKHRRPPSPAAEGFYTPFAALRQQLRARASSPSTSPAPPAAEVSPQDLALFLAEMADVTPLPADVRGRVAGQKRRHPALPPPRAEASALAELREVVSGQGPFVLQDTDEYTEGVAPGVDRRLAQRLHRGDYAIQAHLDLHGATAEEARAQVEQFLLDAYLRGKRCVLLIHGRGHNSKDHRPVLKEHVRTWLSRGRLSRLVLAFATAPPHNGGAGAVCVLLRRARRLPPR